MAAILLTKSYQEVSRRNLIHGDLVTYAKYSTQSKETNKTTYQLKTVMSMQGYYNEWSFDSANAYLDDAHKVYGYTTFYRGDTTIQEITRTSEHNADGSSKTVQFYSGFFASYGGGADSRPEITFPKIDRYPMLSTAPDFNDEENPTITYTKVLGFEGATVEAGITSQDKNTVYVPYRSIVVDNGEYTFNLTNQERETLRNATSNSNTLNVQFRIRTTTTNNVEYYSDLEKVMTIVNANPTFTYTSEEQNANVISMLGSDDGTTLVANVSELEFTYTPTPYKGSTIKQFNVSEGIVGTTYQSYTLTTAPYVQTFDVTGTTYSGKFVHTLIDSRNNQTTIEDNQRTLLDYDIVRINSYNFKRQSQTNSNIILNAEFGYWGNIGSYTNTPIVKYKLDNGSWVTIPSTNYIIDSTNHKLTITNFTISNAIPYTSQGQFSISIEDILTLKTDTSANGRILKGVPTFDYGEHDLKVNGHLYIADESGQNPQEVLAGGDTIPINSIFEYSGSTIPDGYEEVEAIITGEQPVKTGRCIDGKEEYVKRYSFSTSSLDGSHQVNINSGLTLSAITIIKIEGVIKSSSDNIFSLDTAYSAGGYVTCFVRNSDSNIVLSASTANFQHGATINIYFTYNS